MAAALIPNIDRERVSLNIIVLRIAKFFIKECRSLTFKLATVFSVTNRLQFAAIHL